MCMCSVEQPQHTRVCTSQAIRLVNPLARESQLHEGMGSRHRSQSGEDTRSRSQKSMQIISALSWYDTRTPKQSPQQREQSAIKIPFESQRPHLEGVVMTCHGPLLKRLTATKHRTRGEAIDTRTIARPATVCFSRLPLARQLTSVLISVGRIVRSVLSCDCTTLFHTW